MDIQTAVDRLQAILDYIQTKYESYTDINQDDLFMLKNLTDQVRSVVLNDLYLFILFFVSKVK